MRTRVRFRVRELNRHPIADEFDARFRRPAWLRNLLAGLQSGRLYDRVRNGSQQPAALLLRTFNSRLVPGAAPPIPRRSSNLSARTRRNPHQPARPDARPLIFNKTVSWSALADCGLSVGRISGSPRWPAVPPTLQIVGTCRYLPTNRNISQLTLTWATTSWSRSPGTTPRRPQCRPAGRARARRASETWGRSPGQLH